MNLDPTDLLLQDRLSPITSSLGFLQAEPQRIVEDFVRWKDEAAELTGLRAQHELRSFAQCIVHARLEGALESLLPLCMGGANRFLFLPTASPWTLYLDNNYRGTDATAIEHMAVRLGCRSVWVVASPHTLRFEGRSRHGSEGELILAVYDSKGSDASNLVREIRLISDTGRWEFSQQGRPFPFEQLGKYGVRSVRDRFDFSMLKTYLTALGILAFDEAFYLPSETAAILLEQQSHCTAISLADARRSGYHED